MKLSKLILSLTILVACALCNKATAFDHFIKIGSNAIEAVSQQGNNDNDHSTINKAVSTESFYLKTSTQGHVTSRVEKRHFLDALFLSFGACGKMRVDDIRFDEKPPFYFAPLALKLIYPHHYFW